MDALIQDKMVAEMETAYQENKRQWNNSGRLILDHVGLLSQSNIDEYSVGIENLLQSLEVKKPKIKAIFSVLVEALQNIMIHGYSGLGRGMGYFMVYYKQEVCTFEFCNFIEKASIDKVRSLIDRVNAMDREALKSYYLQVLDNGEISEKGGAGLGFITIAMKCKNKIAYHFEELSEDDLYLFQFSTKIEL